MSTNPLVQIGTISHGTLRTQDLIPAFYAELKRLDPARAADWARKTLLTPDNWEDSKSAIWDTSYTAEDLDALYDLLNECAPDGVYFGAIEGDGSDFGFWRIDEPEPAPKPDAKSTYLMFPPPDATSTYLIDGSRLLKLKAVAKRLYSEMRMTGDEMRDAAQAIDAIVEEAAKVRFDP